MCIFSTAAYNKAYSLHCSMEIITKAILPQCLEVK